MSCLTCTHSPLTNDTSIIIASRPPGSDPPLAALLTCLSSYVFIDVHGHCFHYMCCYCWASCPVMWTLRKLVYIFVTDPCFLKTSAKRFLKQYKLFSLLQSLGRCITKIETVGYTSIVIFGLYNTTQLTLSTLKPPHQSDVAYRETIKWIKCKNLTAQFPNHTNKWKTKWTRIQIDVTRERNIKYGKGTVNLQLQHMYTLGPNSAFRIPSQI